MESQTKMLVYTPAIYNVCQQWCDKKALRMCDEYQNLGNSMLTLNIGSLALPEIQTLSYQLHTSGKHCVKYEYHRSKTERGFNGPYNRFLYIWPWPLTQRSLRWSEILTPPEVKNEREVCILNHFIYLKYVWPWPLTSRSYRWSKTFGVIYDDREQRKVLYIGCSGPVAEGLNKSICMQSTTRSLDQNTRYTELCVHYEKLMLRPLISSCVNIKVLLFYILSRVSLNSRRQTKMPFFRRKIAFLA